MRLTRWIPTFLAFPLAGLLTIETVGAFDGSASGAAAGLLAGAVIGAGQWLALVVAMGALAGGAVGAAQATQLARGAAAWTLASAAAWVLGWLVTAEIIVDLDRGYVVFGSSGALTATLLTGLVLQRLLAPSPRVAVA